MLNRSPLLRPSVRSQFVTKSVQRDRSQISFLVFRLLKKPNLPPVNLSADSQLGWKFDVQYQFRDTYSRFDDQRSGVRVAE